MGALFFWRYFAKLMLQANKRPYRSFIANANPQAKRYRSALCTVKMRVCLTFLFILLDFNPRAVLI